MRKIECAWLEKIISFSELAELQRFIERNKGKHYRYYNREMQEWVLDDITAWYQKTNIDGRFYLHIRIPYGKCRIPQYSPELDKDRFLYWMKEKLDPDITGYSEDYILGFYACFQAVVEGAENEMCSIDY